MRAIAVLSAALSALVALALAPATASAQEWHLPWPAGQAVYVTQDCNDSCCNDHVGHNAYAWDFATHGSFDVVAPRAGTITHVKMSSNHGGDASAVDAANYLVIDHGDGTASVMLHLAHGSLDPAVRCGEFVRAGQRLAVTGSTGWSSGNHLHYQLTRIPARMPQVCECGPDGMACGEDESHWGLFWSHNAASSTLPVQFNEWRGASVCNDRHDDNILVSRNVDAREPVVTIDDAEPGRFSPVAGSWTVATGGARGTYRQAASSAPASARISLEGRVPTPGVYEIWQSVPAEERNTGMAAVRARVIARGEVFETTISQTGPGGGYRLVAPRVKLSGRAGEALELSADAASAQALAFDAVVLRRVGDAGRALDGSACRATAECRGDLVCDGGVCRAGCDATSCAAGAACQPTGLCAAPAAPSPAESVTARPAPQPAAQQPVAAQQQPARRPAPAAAVVVPSPQQPVAAGGGARSTTQQAQPTPRVVPAGLAPAGRPAAPARPRAGLIAAIVSLLFGAVAVPVALRRR